MEFITNPIYVLAVLFLLIILSIYAGNTRFGKQFGPALLVIVFGAILANLGLIPTASNSIELYSSIFTYIAPISIFYLLLGVNLSSLKQAGLPMIGLFLIGSLATAAGILVSWFMFSPAEVLGDKAAIIAGMLTGTYTGGSINFNAVALEYGFQENGVLYAGTIAVDNVVTTLWIIVTLALPHFMQRLWKARTRKTNGLTTTEESPAENKVMNLLSMAWLAFLGIGGFLLSEYLSSILPGVPFILILSTLGIILAQIKFVSRLKGSHDLGLYLVYLFLAVIGAYCELSAVAELKTVGLTLILFTGVAVILHGLITILLGGLVYRDWEMIAIVSQANIGGGTTAIALAETFKRKELALPAILVGTLGNALGTYLGFLIVYIL